MTGTIMLGGGGAVVGGDVVGGDVVGGEVVGGEVVGGEVVGGDVVGGEVVGGDVVGGEVVGGDVVVGAVVGGAVVVGAVVVVTAPVWMEEPLVPVDEVAVTVNLTVEDHGRFATTHETAGAVATHDCPVVDVAVYDTIALVPTAIGASHCTVAELAVADVRLAEGALGAQGAARWVVIPSATSTRSEGIV